MIFPCPSKLDCPGSDFPISNLSSETPDQDVFLGDNFGFAWIVPPIGSNWTRSHCLGVCTSTVSQAEADICAALQNILCLIDTWGVCPDCTDPDLGNGSSGPPLIFRKFNGANLFYNSQQFCTAECPDGTPFTWGINAGVVGMSSQKLADDIAFSLACDGARANIFCLGSLSKTSTCYQEPYSGTIAATKPVANWALVAGALPVGVHLQSVTQTLLRLVGIPTTAGTYTFTLRANLASGSFMNKTYTLNVLGFTVAQALPDATDGVPYAFLVTSAGGVGAVTYLLESGTLPTGLTLDAAGNITGTPTETGDFSPTIRITDSASNFCIQTFALLVGPGSLNCPSNLTTYAASNAQSIIGSVDPAVGRVFVAGLAAVEMVIYNSITDALVATAGAGVQPNSGGAWVKSTQQFAVRGTTAAGNGYWLVDSNTGAATQIGNKLSLYSIPSYADDDDACWGLGWDVLGTNDVFLTRLNIGTLLVDISVNVGNSASSPFYTAYCPVPKTLLTTGVGTNDTMTLYSLPAGGVVATFDFAAGGFGACYQLVYNPITSTFFAAIVQDAAPRQERVIEINPFTMGIIRTYNLGTFNGGNNMQIDVDPDNGAIYCHSLNMLTCIDAVGQVIKCQIPFASSSGAQFDKASGRIFAVMFGPSRVAHFDK